jgi:UDP-glucose 4-epimerase
MKVLVTGAEGYIGSHLCQMIQNTRPDIEVYRLEWINTDIRGYYNGLCEWEEYNFDTVIHLAGLVRVGESVRDPIDYYETNVTGTLNVLRALSYKNFIFASTGAAANPSSPYAYSKLMAESIIKQKLGENDYTIFRFYNVIGTDGHPATNPDGLFYNLKNAVTSGGFSLYGTDYDTKDGTAVREYVHVNDICKAIIKAIDKPSNSIENLAYGDTRTVQEIIDIFKKVNNVDFKVNLCPRREGDLAENYLKNPSTYMERNYTYEEMLKL